MRFPFFRNRDSVKNGILISIRRTGDGFHPGLFTNFHAKKVEYILQEIFARLTIYNFCERIITTIAIQQKNRKYTYQTNFTVAVFICREYFRDRIHPSDLVALIRKNILPIREGRKAPRKVRPNSSKQLLI